jgi:hypothetical protein
MTYVNPHRSQYAAGQSAVTRSSGCTWTSVTNGANASTGGRVNKTPDQVKALVKASEETSPASPGWSIPDAVLACKRLGVPAEDRSGKGWHNALAALDGGQYILLQGDSDRFSNATCSGAFDGDHAIGIHPKKKFEAGLVWRWIDDPICQTGRWEKEITLRAYAEKLSAGVRFMVFLTKVPTTAYVAPAPTVTLRYGGKKLTPRQVKKIAVPSGRKAVRRKRPTTSAPQSAPPLANGTRWTASQVTTTGQLLSGSRKWYGNAKGNSWFHVTAF